MNSSWERSSSERERVSRDSEVMVAGAGVVAASVASAELRAPRSWRLADRRLTMIVRRSCDLCRLFG